MHRLFPKLLLNQYGSLLAASLLALVLVIQGVGCNRSAENVPPQQTNSTTIKIGANLALTETYGYFGTQLSRGMEIAALHGNKSLSEARVEFIFEDNRHNVPAALAAFDKLVEQNRVSAIVTIYSPIAKALRTEAVRAKIPLIATYTTAKEIPNEWTFRDFPTLEQQVPPLAQFARQEIGMARAASLVFDVDFGLEAQRLFEAAFTTNGGTIVAKDGVALNVTDEQLGNAVLHILGAKPETVLLILSAKPLATATKKLRENGFTGPILGIVMYDSPEIWNDVGNLPGEIYFTGIPIRLDLDALGKAFDNDYKKRFGSDPDYMAVFGYSIGSYLITEARRANGDRDGLRKGLERLNIQTVRGKVLSDTTHSIQSPVTIFKRAGGRTTVVKNIELPK